MTTCTERGFVSLVGAGPGDPGLLTVRGRKAIQDADVVLYDHLASPALLSAVDVPGQERIHVGKAAGVGFSSQDAINALLVRRASQGQRVVRLKGGDPFVFGRGAEEALALYAAGIAFEIIPGVSSAFAAPALAGIPITHRDHASAFTVLTGHEREDGDVARVPDGSTEGQPGSTRPSAATAEGQPGSTRPSAVTAEGQPGSTRPSAAIDWEHVGKLGGTVVVLMGMKEVARWTASLIRGGRGPETPVAFVRWGTLPRQEVLVTTLGAAAADVAARGLRSPAVAVVGDVVTLRPALMTLERLPLFGQVIGLTRDGDDEPAFESLERLGAALHHLPLTRQRLIDLPNGVPALAARLAAPTPTATPSAPAAPSASSSGPSFTDLVFTSRNGVKAFRAALDLAGVDARALAAVTTWAVGPATALAMREVLTLSADHVPERATAEGLVALASSLGVAGRRFLFPAAAGARRVLPDGLAALGAVVDEVAVYETIPEPSAPARLLSALEEGLTLLTVASPSAVSSLAAALDQAQLPRAHIPVAAIGPTTAEAALRAGLDVAVVPEQFNLEALAEAIVEAGRAGRLRRPSPLHRE
ncbi:MAG: uroporphyrinogen-III C-methyltransferase [Deltaproteobacteria bacterium]|nr:uroporphyrinogen-III C-methyltransferase [Deltaproteobacteria bacterium]